MLLEFSTVNFLDSKKRYSLEIRAQFAVYIMGFVFATLHWAVNNNEEELCRI